MKHVIKVSALATALALSVGAHADEPGTTLPVAGDTSASSLSAAATRADSSTATMNWSSVGTTDAEATASSNTVQTTTDNMTANAANSPNNARMESGAGDGATGNIGINIAAGTGNLQGNSASIVNTNVGEVFASANSVLKQTTVTNASINLDNAPNEAFMDAALAGASGNIGVNIAAGSGNAQSNQLSMIETGGNRVSRAATAIEQTASGNQSENSSSYESMNSANNAIMATSAMAMAGGNIGVSITAGVGNGQANALAVTVMAR
jgi:hypothetical protein